MSEHYFSAEPGSARQDRSITVHLAGRDREVRTSTGVFSYEHVDAGTQVLLRALPELVAEATPPAGDVLDLGCGWGPVALTAALAAREQQELGRGVANVWAVDVNSRALELAAANASLLGVGELVRCAAPEEVPADARFAQIWSNPPIRIGKSELHSLLRQWLARLLPGGAAFLVVAKQLGAPSLLSWLGEELPGWDVSRAHRDRGFHVLRVVRPEH